MIQGFPPIKAETPCFLILGSAPSVLSLQKGEYYGHPRNAFWKIMSEIFCVDFNSYEEKKALVMKNNITIWDVIKSCNREGSLDSAIKDEQLNDLKKYIDDNSTLKKVLFNGGKAYSLYKKYINYFPKNIEFIKMPSTSPAYTLSFDKKKSIWERAILN